jgi:hypothetical protein
MKRTNLRDKLKKKCYRDKLAIQSISESIRDSFDKAYDIASTAIREQIAEGNEKNETIAEKINSITFEDGNQPSEEELSAFDEFGENAYAIHSNEDALLSLSEMRVIFLFKTIEKAIKEMVEIAFPKINSRDLFRWDMLISHLRANGVEIKTLNGYQETNWLRIVNNNIKHSLNIDTETKNIPCFSAEDKFTHVNLEIFYKSIEIPAQEFMSALGQEIVKSAYELSTEKLEEITNEIVNRYDSKQIIEIINKLSSKI